MTTLDEAISALTITPEQRKVMRKLSRKIETIYRAKWEQGNFYRVRVDEYGCAIGDDPLTARGRALIDSAADLIEQLRAFDDTDWLVWFWYCREYNDDVTFSAGDLAA